MNIYTVCMIDLRDNAFNYEFVPLAAFTDKDKARRYANLYFQKTGDRFCGWLSAGEMPKNETDRILREITLGKKNLYVITGENLIIYVSEMTLLEGDTE